ncbi:ABC transporter G family member 26 [Hibiscus syriacus]|uniref:ABC transporter G family member 26 n=1 Tax=Hibiscus syriacus TaxID=106335 RepID=A0A6A3A0V9_HIBSY|nr:ABC transporter G family member 26 [Hibiscus syriacus]
MVVISIFASESSDKGFWLPGGEFSSPVRAHYFSHYLLGLFKPQRTWCINREATIKHEHYMNLHYCPRGVPRYAMAKMYFTVLRSFGVSEFQSGGCRSNSWRKKRPGVGIFFNWYVYNQYKECRAKHDCLQRYVSLSALQSDEINGRDQWGRDATGHRPSAHCLKAPGIMSEGCPRLHVATVSVITLSSYHRLNLETGIPRSISRTTPLLTFDMVPVSYMKFEDLENKVRSHQPASINPHRPGEIRALMGPSGSGKTTLLKIIGGRLTDNVKGNITYNDLPYSLALKRRIGFVTQDDILLPQLTVEETLVFSAFLRLPSDMSLQQKYAKGYPVEKGKELASVMKFSLIHHCTSGLDSTSANKLIHILQEVAKAGRTVITRIHQPSNQMFHMFNKVLLISEGYPIYSGKARDCMEYFSSLRFIPEIAMNPAEFLLDLATGQVHDITLPEDPVASQGTAESEKAVIKYLQLKYKTHLEPKEKEENHRSSKAPQHLRMAIQVKDWTITWSCSLARLLWWKLSAATEAQLRDQIGLLFYICIFWTSTSISERTLCDMVAHVLYPTSFMLIVYFMAGFKRTVVCFFLTLFTILLIAIISQVSQAISDIRRSLLLRPKYSSPINAIFDFAYERKTREWGAAVLSIKRVGMMASLVLMLFLLTGGYYVQHIPKFMQWMKYSSFMYYGFRLLVRCNTLGTNCKNAKARAAVGIYRIRLRPTRFTSAEA